MTRWFRSYWLEEDIWFYFEADSGGLITRQVELQGPLEKPIAAAALAEWDAAQRAGAVGQYETVFGRTAENPVGEWEEHDPQELTAAEFESVWTAARAACLARARTRSAPGA
ncbi:hypothetical protein [Streptomyces cupreus]|uniref:Uncharacterized protein n=1 Tax=Streptomyces cupreus TaxID=2759956 RepID=A0A7X1M8N5_9ACTN|nr:hypothetical protein [Streptomyces cupreus]MBC2901896.1 hypothetical protein [Streptomyces cupreus]